MPRLSVRLSTVCALVAVLLATAPGAVPAKSVAPFPCKSFGAKLDRYQKKLERQIEKWRTKAEKATDEELQDNYRLAMQRPRGELAAANQSERRVGKENCHHFEYKAVIRWLTVRANRAFKAKARANQQANNAKSKEKAQQAIMRLDFFDGKQGAFGKIRTWVRHEARKAGVA